MTWKMPLLAAMSAPVTLVPFTMIASASDTANLTVGVLRRGRALPSALGRTGTASVFAAFVEIDITCLALASSVVLFTDLALAPLPDLPP